VPSLRGLCIFMKGVSARVPSLAGTLDERYHLPTRRPVEDFERRRSIARPQLRRDY
jgi:hypothetical protein